MTSRETGVAGQLGYIPTGVVFTMRAASAWRSARVS